MAQYTVELSWDTVVISPTGPVDATWDPNNPLAGVLVRASLSDHSGTSQFFGIQVLLYAHSYGAGPTYELTSCQRPWNVSGTEFSLGFPFSPNPATGFFQAANGDNGTLFINPPTSPTVSIVVDDATQTVAYNGPLGSYTATFASLGWATGIVSNVALGDIAAIMEPAEGTQNHQFSLTFFDFYLSFGGEPTMGAALGSLQPGVWLAPGPWTSINLGSPLGTVGLTDGTTETRLILSFLWDHTTNHLGIFEALVHWDAVHGNKIADVELLLSAFKHPDEGVFVYARVIKQHVDAVEVGTSRDLGHTWTTQLVGKATGRFYISPSLCSSPDGSINLFVNDRSVKFTRWFKSYTYGVDWIDNGAVLPLFVWTNVTHPKFFTLSNGVFVMTYNQIGHLAIQFFDGTAGTGFFNHDFGPQAGGFDAYPAIWQNDRGEIYVAFEGAALETEMHTADWGVAADWDQVYQAALLSQQVVMVKDPASPFLWKLFQGPASGGVSDLLVQGSADAGITALSAAVVVVAAIPEQYSGLIVGPLAELLVIRQLYNSGTDHWQIQPWISRDFGQTFVPA